MVTESLVIFVVATTGQGDPPSNMKVSLLGFGKVYNFLVQLLGSYLCSDRASIICKVARLRPNEELDHVALGTRQFQVSFQLRHCNHHDIMTIIKDTGYIT